MKRDSYGSQDLEHLEPPTTPKAAQKLVSNLIPKLSSSDIYNTRCFFRFVWNETDVRVRLVGLFNNWNVDQGIELYTSPDIFPCWTSREPIALPLNKRVEYKYVVIRKQPVQQNSTCIDGVDYPGSTTSVDRAYENPNGLRGGYQRPRSGRGYYQPQMDVDDGEEEGPFQFLMNKIVDTFVGEDPNSKYDALHDSELLWVSGPDLDAAQKLQHFRDTSTTCSSGSASLATNYSTNSGDLSSLATNSQQTAAAFDSFLQLALQNASDVIELYPTGEELTVEDDGGLFRAMSATNSTGEKSEAWKAFNSGFSGLSLSKARSGTNSGLSGLCLRDRGEHSRDRSEASSHSNSTQDLQEGIGSVLDGYKSLNEKSKNNNRRIWAGSCMVGSLARENSSSPPSAQKHGIYKRTSSTGHVGKVHMRKLRDIYEKSSGSDDSPCSEDQNPIWKRLREIEGGDVKLSREDTVMVIAFQLPLRVARTNDGTWAVTPSKANLVPALHQCARGNRGEENFRMLCVGWPGIHITSPYEQRQLTDLLLQYDCIPVFPPAEDFERYLHFCHQLLWPVFHDVMRPNLLDFTSVKNKHRRTRRNSSDSLSSEKNSVTKSAQKNSAPRVKTPSLEDMWCSYQRINQCYADAVIRASHHSDIFWTHDYYLLLVPQYVTRKIRKANVGLYLHAPFPSSDIFACLPVREEMLRAMLCVDMLGFQFYEYFRKFCVTCKKLLGLDSTFMPNGQIALEYSGRSVIMKIAHVCISMEEITGEIEKLDDLQKALAGHADESLKDANGTSSALELESSDHLMGRSDEGRVCDTESFVSANRRSSKEDPVMSLSVCRGDPLVSIAEVPVLPGMLPEMAKGRLTGSSSTDAGSEEPCGPSLEASPDMMQLADMPSPDLCSSSISSSEANRVSGDAEMLAESLLAPNVHKLTPNAHKTNTSNGGNIAVSSGTDSSILAGTKATVDTSALELSNISSNVAIMKTGEGIEQTQTLSNLSLWSSKSSLERKSCPAIRAEASFQANGDPTGNCRNAADIPIGKPSHIGRPVCHEDDIPLIGHLANARENPLELHGLSSLNKISGLSSNREKDYMLTAIDEVSSAYSQDSISRASTPTSCDEATPRSSKSLTVRRSRSSTASAESIAATLRRSSSCERKDFQPRMFLDNRRPIQHAMVECKAASNISKALTIGSPPVDAATTRSGVKKRWSGSPRGTSSTNLVFSFQPDPQERLGTLFRLKEKYPNRTVFAGLDRCDALAGVMLKIRMFRQFLVEFPHHRGNVLLVQFVHPSNNPFKADKLETVIDALVKEVNDELGFHILLYIDEVDRNEKLALWRSADVLIDTQVRDGLNLGPFEFLACHQHDKRAVLILSEFTGSSRVLHGALQVNPWNTQQVMIACDRCCRMPNSDREDRWNRDFAYVVTHSLLRWAESFLVELKAARKKDDVTYVSYGFGANYRLISMDSSFRKLQIDSVVKAYRSSRTCRVFFLDNEGTLAADLRHIYGRQKNHIAHEAEVSQLHSTGSPPRESVLQCLRELLKDARNIVMVISGRSKSQMQDWFRSVDNIGLAAEHGWCYRLPSLFGDEWYVAPCNAGTAVNTHGGNSEVEDLSNSTWKKIAFELMKGYAQRTQRSYIENKGSALVWTYRDSDPEFGRWQAKELSQHLQEFMFGYPVEIIEGKGYIEVKLIGVNKGVAVSKILSKITQIRGEPDFVVCVGDDRSDEAMFEVVNSIAPEESEENTVNNNSASQSLLGGLASMATATYPSTSSSKHYFSCTVGQKPSKARYFLHDVDEVSDLLESLKGCVSTSLETDGERLSMLANSNPNTRFLTAGRKCRSTVGFTNCSGREVQHPQAGKNKRLEEDDDASLRGQHKSCANFLTTSQRRDSERRESQLRGSDDSVLSKNRGDTDSSYGSLHKHSSGERMESGTIVVNQRPVNVSDSDDSCSDVDMTH